MKLIITSEYEVDNAVAEYLAGPRGHVEVETKNTEWLMQFVARTHHITGIPFEQVTTHLLPRCSGKVVFVDFLDTARLVADRKGAGYNIRGVYRDGPIFLEISLDGKLTDAMKLSDDIDAPLSRPRGILGRLPVDFPEVYEIHERILSEVQHAVDPQRFPKEY